MMLDAGLEYFATSLYNSSHVLVSLIILLIPQSELICVSIGS